LLVPFSIQVALDLGQLKQFIDFHIIIEAPVGLKTDFRREFQIDAVRDLRTQMFPLPAERGENFRDVFTTKRHNIDGGKLQIRAHANFRDRYRPAFENVITQSGTGQELGHGMTDEFGDAQHSLRRHAALVVGSGHRYLDLFGLGRAPAGKPNQSFHGTHGRMSDSGIGLFMERVLFERKQDLLPAFHFVRLPRGSLHCNANREAITQYLTASA
jgi:hypothetical protein